MSLVSEGTPFLFQITLIMQMCLVVIKLTKEFILSNISLPTSMDSPCNIFKSVYTFDMPQVRGALDVGKKWMLNFGIRLKFVDIIWYILYLFSSLLSVSSRIWSHSSPWGIIFGLLLLCIAHSYRVFKLNEAF